MVSNCCAFLSIPIIVVGLAVAFQFAMMSGDVGEPNINVITKSDVVEEHLSAFRDVIGSDYDGYRGHIYRCLSYSMHFLNGNETHRDVIEAALVYHDIGLWTDSELAYLEPSAAQAQIHCKDKFTADQILLIKDIIMFHHKITPFPGDDAHAKVVEAVRKSDWIDASMGLITKGMSRANIKKVESSIANAGFHKTLRDFIPRLRGWNIPLGAWELAHIMRW
mmetsp:Transcript_35284/g.68620  ORF Transcript_35284/g.68620 Transcript_35284/m.68620 type:complete len:221 (+) Transcript_35284:62-724(+)